MKACSEAGCSRPFRARGYCVYHYTLKRKSGELRDAIGTVETTLAKIKRSVGCWSWSGGHNKAGYGTMKPSEALGQWYLAHRWVYTYYVGEIPEGLFLDHLCRNRGCVNPTHLEPVTHEENMRRGAVARPCKKGHEFTPENTVWESGGTVRRCKTCRNNNRLETKGVLAYAS